jgi:hypothetical protein
MSKTPWALFAALSGHPIELQTYFVRTLAVRSGEKLAVKIADDVENGEAELETPSPSNFSR